jgi:hypothetical protein
MPRRRVIEMARAHVVMDPAGIIHIDHLAGETVRSVTREVAQDIRRRVPVDTGELEESVTEVVTETTGRVFVGTDHWAAVEYGTRPHLIRSTGPWPLRNRETGQQFGRVVHHPGTPAQPFMRPALYRQRDL